MKSKYISAWSLRIIWLHSRNIITSPDQQQHKVEQTQLNSQKLVNESHYVIIQQFDYRIKLMSATEITQEIQVTGSLLSLNIFEEKLMRNFFIINSRLRKLDQIQEIDIKLKALQKQQKFMNNKMDAMAEKLPKDGSLSRNDIKMIVKDQIFEVLNSKDDRLNTCKYTEDLLKQIQGLKVDVARIRVDGPDSLFKERKDSLNNTAKVSFSAGQSLLQQNKKAAISRQSLQQVLDKNQMNVVDNIIKGQQQAQQNGNPILDQFNRKFEDIYQQLHDIKIQRVLNDQAIKDISKFQKYEHYQQKSQETARKLRQKSIRLDGIKNQNVKGQILKNDLYTEYQKAQLIKAEMNKTDGRKSFKGQTLFPQVVNQGQTGTLTPFIKDDLRQIKADRSRGQIKVYDQGEGKQKLSRLKPSKSVKKLQRIQRRLKVDDIKDINTVLRQIQLRIEGRVTHDIFMGFVQDIEQKLQILRITKDPTNQLSQLRKMLYSVENRLQAVIIYLQNSANQDDALLVKKQWACISCDKNIDKFNGKIGQHLNWDNLSSKKISPTKAGAFGQTGQLASKIRSLMDNQKSGE